MWVLKKLVVHFGLKSFAERTLTSWWVVLEKLGREREEALLPGPIKGLAQFLLRIDTKVTSQTDLKVLVVPVLKSVISHILTWAHTHTHTHLLLHWHIFVVFSMFVTVHIKDPRGISGQ